MQDIRIHRGDIFWVRQDYAAVGSEARKNRPAIIVSTVGMQRRKRMAVEIALDGHFRVYKHCISLSLERIRFSGVQRRSSSI